MEKKDKGTIEKMIDEALLPLSSDTLTQDYLRHLANITHELKTPLHSILSVATLLSSEVDGPLNEEQKKQVSIISRNGENLLNLINSLLEYSASSTDSNKLSIVPIDLKRSMEDLYEELQPVAEKKQIKLKLNISECPQKFYTDISLLRKIIVNLVSNSIKFSPSHSVIEINAWMDSNLNLQIVDSGIGMSPEVKDQVFKAFFQADSSSTRLYGGVGLGLSLVRVACDKLNGTLELQSEQGKGSIFTVKIPDLFDLAPKIKVLLVEEDESVREAISYCIKDVGYQLILANPSEVINTIIQDQPTLIVLDVGSSDRKGAELVRNIRSTLAGAQIPILGMSANDEPKERAEAFALGITDLLLKPFDLSEFLVRINYLIFD